MTAVLPLTEQPEPPVCCDDEIHLPALEFPVRVDPALDGRCPITPADIAHIGQRRAE